MAVRALTALALATLVVAANDFALDGYFAPPAGDSYLDPAAAAGNGSERNSSRYYDSSGFFPKLDEDFTTGAKEVEDGIIYELSDAQYYAMPRLFELDEYRGCLAAGSAYCRGSFELLPAAAPHPLYTTMQRFSANTAHHFNHTRLHRGVCLPRRCPRAAPPAPPAWFAACVNESTMAEFGLSARLYRLDYCVDGEQAAPLSSNQRGFAALLALLLALAAVSTTLDLALSDKAKEDAGWALSWSLRQSWRALTAPPAPAPDLVVFDGLRIFCLMCVIIEHVCWLATLSYVYDTRSYEKMRLDGDVMLMTNSTLVVQIFFLMASFLLANKLLNQKDQNQHPIRTFFSTMLNRIIRISPSYFFVVWFASSWWERLGSGPQWAPLVGAEAAACRRKWWTQLLYVNNLVMADDKCLIQTWYLAADMQLYALALVLTLALRGRRAALPLLAGLFAVVTLVTFILAYAWELVPTIIVHRPEAVREEYRGDASFNALYQSPLGNAPGALAGLLLAHAHHALRDSPALTRNQVFRWASVLAAPGALWWAAWSPRALGPGPPERLAAAALAALERPVFMAFVFVGLLGAINGVQSPWRSWFAAGGAALARLSFGALLLHIPINQALQGARLAPAQIDRQTAILEWFGVAFLSYAAAVPLALLVEFPAMRLHRELTAPRRAAPRRPQPALNHQQKPQPKAKADT